MNKWLPGTIVKFATVLEPDDKNLLMVVIEDRDERVLVEAVVDLPVRPQYSYLKSDLIVVDRG